ncbi:DEAD/DEAH box helicase [Ornithinibacillus halophilus]|uniref:Helicase ATP-binding domain-containing protein n=1 Tax=Ornithinibacillus halophilus TaxID=930117 RepID=A0A1M5FGK0_9BACI|nr:DEAD/DEAH box helicase [Ornithinibacillus halophilus]SHF90608.1 hypothetical protein SAMN05216225_100880 [Ornithinibacillus halophilus]
MENLNQLQKLQYENERLIKENNYLKDLLQRHNIPIGSMNTTPQQIREQAIRDRIEIFKSLFKGRSDVYAVRQRNKNNKYIYVPVRESNGYRALTDQDIYEHLAGEKTIGLYPLMKNNKCWFLAIDFDKKNWRVDVQNLLKVCNDLDVPANLEISRSGNGCHVWIFFTQAIFAKEARNLGDLLLTKAQTNSFQSKFDSYDRMFPSQDELSEGGIGNLIALPLQHHPRKDGNSVFVDKNFNIYPNQWEYMAKIKRMEYEKILSLIDSSTSEKTTKITNVDLPDKLEIIEKNGIYIPKDQITSKLQQELTKLASLNNPAYYKAKAQRFSTKNIPRVIECFEDEGEYLILPRGRKEEILNLLKDKKVKVQLNYQENKGKQINVDFRGDLRLEQEKAVNALLERKNGILSATTGFGKTVVAAAMISRRKVNTLIIVHRKQLMEQWKERLTAFLNIDDSMIGQIGGGKNTAKGFIDIAMVQSLNYKGKVKDVVNQYGQIIVDECHHISAFSFENVLKKVKAEYVHGLTATPTRKDGLHPIMQMQCGLIRYKVSAKQQSKTLPFKQVLIPRNSSYKSSEEDLDIQSMYNELATNKARNEMIFNDVLEELEKGSCPIILTERIEHVKILESMFQNFVKNLVVITGGLSKKDEKQKLKMLKEIPDNQELLVISTGKYIGEGFDFDRLDTMFLVLPISWKGTLQQYVGRLHRVRENKEIVRVYDYVDNHVEVLNRMFKKRMKGYNSLGYVIETEENTSEKVKQMKLF